LYTSDADGIVNSGTCCMYPIMYLGGHYDLSYTSTIDVKCTVSMYVNSTIYNNKLNPLQSAVQQHLLELFVDDVEYN